MAASVKDIGERTAKRAEKADAPQTAATSKLPELSSFSDDELAMLAASAQAELAARREKRRSDFLEHIREQARALGLDPEEVAAALSRKGERRAVRDRRSAVVPKYRNPGNPSETWAGRGVKPKWLQDVLAAGKKLEEFRIPAPPVTA